MKLIASRIMGMFKLRDKQFSLGEFFTWARGEGLTKSITSGIMFVIICLAKLMEGVL